MTVPHCSPQTNLYYAFDELLHVLIFPNFPVEFLSLENQTFQSLKPAPQSNDDLAKFEYHMNKITSLSIMQNP